MSSRTRLPAEIRRDGFRALVQALGPDGAIRFVQELDQGAGDYTRERHAWLDSMSEAEILESMNRAKDSPSRVRPVDPEAA